MPEIPTAVSLNELLNQREWLARLAATLVRDPHHAEDAAQQTWLHALAARTPLRDARSWLSAVLGNTVRQSHRAGVRRARREHEVAAHRVELAATAADANERFETQRIVAAAVQALDEPFRTTVLLHHFDGMSLAAIATSQQVPAGTVRWRLFRAHELLREALAARLGRDDWRRALGALCVPVRRGALLAVALPLLLAAGIVTTAIVWAISGPVHEPASVRTEAASVPTDGTRDEQTVERAVARGAVEQPRSAAGAPATAPATADQSAMIRARIVGSDGAPLAGATLRIADVSLGGRQAPPALVAMLVPAATAGADGRVALALRAPREMLALVRGARLNDVVARVTAVAGADDHADESVELHVANGDDRDLGTIALVATSTVSGRVVDEQGQPVADARVCMLRPPFPRFCEVLAARQEACGLEPATTTAAGTGTFELAGVPSGPAIAWASSPGFASAWRTIDVAGSRTQCDDLVLRAGTAVAPAPSQRQIDVLVVDGDGAPVPDARVAYRQRFGSGVISSGSVLVGSEGHAMLPVHTSDATGRDPIAGLELAVTSPRPALASVLVPQPPELRDRVRIVLPPAAPFEVHARTADGTTVARFDVVWNADASAPGQGSAVGNGGIAVLSAPPVAATFEVAAPGCAAQRVRFVPGETPSPLTVTLAPQRGITGVVTAGGRPVAGALVSVLHCREVLVNGFRSDGERKGDHDARTGGDGRFRIDDAGCGAIRLQVRADDRAPWLSDRHDFDPENGWNDIAVELPAGGTIEGVVRDRTGSVAPRALVAIHDFHGDVRTVFADASGRFRCAHLRSGGYEVRVTNRALDGSWSLVRSLTAATAAAAVRHDCEVKDGEVTRFQLVVDRCRAAGRLLPTGFATRGWRATLARAHDGIATCKETTLGADGAFALSSSSEGPHDLRFSSPGGPLGNVVLSLRIDLVAGDNTVDVPLALAPFAGRADGAAGARDGVSSYLEQEAPLRRVLAYVYVDPTTLTFTTPFAPVGENVLVESATAGGARELGRFDVAPR